jgi:hypothetical protein
MKLEKNALDIYRILENVYGNGTISRIQWCGLNNFETEGKIQPSDSFMNECSCGEGD